MIEEADKYRNVVLMISKNVDELYGEKLPKLTSIKGDLTRITLVDGESLKNIRNYQKIVRVLIERRVERDSLFIYIGGGTVGDLAGFIASTYKRGVDLIAVPTTLLAQVDSSIGGKNGINFSGVKNIIGTFYNPKIILADLSFIRNSDVSYMKDGVAEIIKYGIIADHTILGLLRSHDDLQSLRSHENLNRIISKSIRIKGEIVNKDFFDRKGIRSSLNFGHTVGHAIESASKNKISHGRAVATGMLVESFIGEKMGICNSEIRDEIQNMMSRFSINRVSLRGMGLENLTKYIYNDKKIDHGVLKMVIPEEMGKFRTVEIEPEKFSSYVRSFIESYDFQPNY